MRKEARRVILYDDLSMMNEKYCVCLQPCWVVSSDTMSIVILYLQSNMSNSTDNASFTLNSKAEIHIYNGTALKIMSNQNDIF